MNKRSYPMGLKYKLPALLSILPLTAVYSNAVNDEEKTNFIIILVDDIGYNDLECYNSPGKRNLHTKY